MFPKIVAACNMTLAHLFKFLEENTKLFCGKKRIEYLDYSHIFQANRETIKTINQTFANIGGRSLVTFFSAARTVFKKNLQPKKVHQQLLFGLLSLCVILKNYDNKTLRLFESFSRKKRTRFSNEQPFFQKEKRIPGNRVLGTTIYCPAEEPIFCSFSTRTKRASITLIENIACYIITCVILFKEKDVKICENYKPISITPMFAKLFERILLNQVNEFIQKEKNLNGTQFGFQKHKSSTNAVLHLIEALQENYDNLKISVAVFTDLAKIFNSILYKIFLKKIEAYGFSENAIEFFASFLKNRQQCVKINDVYSEWLETNHGVPQGTVLGPFVFLLYINDFREKVQGNFDIIQFADDKSFHFSRNNVSELEKCVFEILEKTDNYLMQNKLTMNTGKTELLCVSKENENFDQIFFRGQEIKQQSHCRYLGIMIDSKLNFHAQLNKLLSNTATAIRSIYLLHYQLPLKARLMLFKSLVLSHLTFSALFFQHLNFSAMQRINRQINWGIKVCYMSNKFERSTDLLVKSDILPAELLISQMSVSKLRNDTSLLKSDGTESFFF